MGNLNPMFSKTIVLESDKKRKKRNDAKTDIKVSVSIEQKKALRILGFCENLSVTQYASKLVIEGVVKDYIQFAPRTHYARDFEFVHVKLEQSVYERLLRLSVEWNCSVRRAAHRVLINILKEQRGIQI